MKLPTATILLTTATMCTANVEMKIRKLSAQAIAKESPILSEPELLDLESVCGSLDYELHLHVDDHIGILALPDFSVADEPSCGSPLYLHYDAVETMSKVIQPLWEDRVDTWIDGEELFPLFTTMDLSSIVAAFDAVPDNSGPYDLIHNNCATFILHFFQEIGVKVDMDMVEDTAHALAENGITGTLLEDEGFVGTLQNSNTAVEDSNFIVEDFVKQYIYRQDSEDGMDLVDF